MYFARHDQVTPSAYAIQTGLGNSAAAKLLVKIMAGTSNNYASGDRRRPFVYELAQTVLPRSSFYGGDISDPIPHGLNAMSDRSEASATQPDRG
jgi:hypothetical protein